MTEHRSYTTEEIAKLLKVSKLTVYDLIKKGKLPAYRVGRQMRVDEADLETYKIQTKETGRAITTSVPTNIPSSIPMNSKNTTSEAKFFAVHSHSPLVITGQDMSLDILARHLEKSFIPLRPLRSNAGSLDSLIAMYKGEADIVSTHLFDGDTGNYNIPYIRKILIGFPYVVIRLLSRWAGFYVQSGNPKKISTWDDLKRVDIQMVNREKGSGVRILLDEQLRLHEIKPEDVAGYANEENNHLSVAGKIANGDCDLGIGIEKVAQIFGVEFIPLIKEQYDLVIVKNEKTRNVIEAVQHVLQSAEFQKELLAIRGYDLTDVGQIIYES